MYQHVVARCSQLQTCSEHYINYHQLHFSTAAKPMSRSHERGRCVQTPQRTGNARGHWASDSSDPAAAGEQSARRYCLENRSPVVHFSDQQTRRNCCRIYFENCIENCTPNLDLLQSSLETIQDTKVSFAIPSCRSVPRIMTLTFSRYYQCRCCHKG